MSIQRRPTPPDKDGRLHSGPPLGAGLRHNRQLLAAALAVPRFIANGHAFPNRETIIFVTSGVIAVTLVAQGLVLPHLVPWARFEDDTAAASEEHLAKVRSTQAALDSLDDLAEQTGVSAHAVDRLRVEYEHQLRLLAPRDSNVDGTDAPQSLKDDIKLRLALIARKREVLIDLREERTIDHSVFRHLSSGLDVEEMRLSRDDVDRATDG